MPYNSWPVMIAFIMVLIGGCVTLGSKTITSNDKKYGVTLLENGDRIRTIKYHGANYIVIERNGHVAICPKAGDVIWTKEVKD